MSRWPRNRPEPVPPTLLADGLPKALWEATDDRGLYQSFSLTATGWVVSYEKLKSYSASESAGSVTFEQFLQGEYQSLVSSTFGDAALADMLASVRYLLEHPELLRRLPN